MNRETWQNNCFFENSAIPWPCPTCGGRLHIEKNSLIRQETSGSIAAKADDNWEPEWTDYKYVCMFKCTNPDCNDVVSACGSGTMNGGWVFVYPDEEPTEDEYSDIYTLQYVSPAFKIIRWPSKCDKLIVAQIENSFAHFWSDASACGNSIRKTIELIMDDKGIPRTTINKKRKRVLISLHDRIVKFGNKRPELASAMLALKFIGNPSSHTGQQVTNSDLLDAYEILENALPSLYDDSGKRIGKIIKAINKRKKPRSSVRFKGF